MRKYFIYLMIYSFGGFLLERVINFFFLGSFYDNSVLVGPYQPLYGAGVLMTILMWDFFIKRVPNPFLKYSLLLFVAVITTGISEAVTGYGMEYLYGEELWDYRDYFPLSLEYIGWIPTSLFGIGSFLVVVFLHPMIRNLVSLMPGMIRRNVFRILLVIFVVDIVYSMFFRYQFVV